MLINVALFVLNKINDSTLPWDILSHSEMLRSSIIYDHRIKIFRLCKVSKHVSESMSMYNKPICSSPAYHKTEVSNEKQTKLDTNSSINWIDWIRHIPQNPSESRDDGLLQQPDNFYVSAQQAIICFKHSFTF